METFDGVIVEADRGGAYIEVPDAVVQALGGRGRVPVQATFDGVAYAGSVVSMGGAKVIGVRKDIRQQLGKEPGDGVTVTLRPDDAPRAVTVADDLRRALVDGGVDATFDGLSFSHQREYVTWIDEAKKAETRARRIAQTVERLGRLA